MTRPTFLLLGMLSACGGPSTDSEPPGPQLADLDADDDGYLEHEDCDETDPDVHPGAFEICDDIDNDCDGLIDEEVLSVWYTDADGDGYGDDESQTLACDEPTDTVSVGGDCDDGDAEVRPGADEICDGRDQDCNGAPDDAGVCLCDVSVREGVAYQFCDFAATWSKSRQICQDYGYDLVTIDDFGEQIWVTDAASQLASHHWWIGLSDESENGDWEWVEGYDLVEEPETWCPGEPDHWDDGCGEEEKAHCAALESEELGCWRDRICDCARSYFICEVTEPTEPDWGG
jgi:hypothetical protein